MKRPQSRKKGVEVWRYSFFNLGTRWRWVASATPRPFCPQERNTVRIVLEAAWAPGPVWRVTENLTLRGLDPLTVQPVASCYAVRNIIAGKLVTLQ